MADSVGADALCLAHRDREVYAEVTGEVVAGQVLRGRYFSHVRSWSRLHPEGWPLGA